MVPGGTRPESHSPSIEVVLWTPSSKTQRTVSPRCTTTKSGVNWLLVAWISTTAARAAPGARARRMAVVTPHPTLRNDWFMKALLSPDWTGSQSCGENHQALREPIGPAPERGRIHCG